LLTPIQQEQNHVLVHPNLYLVTWQEVYHGHYRPDVRRIPACACGRQQLHILGQKRLSLLCRTFALPWTAASRCRNNSAFHFSAPRHHTTSYRQKSKESTKVRCAVEILLIKIVGIQFNHPWTKRSRNSTSAQQQKWPKTGYWILIIAILLPRLWLLPVPFPITYGVVLWQRTP